MARQPLTGSWSRLRQAAAPVIPEHAQPNPEHLDPSVPDANNTGLGENWQSNVYAPVLPDELYSGESDANLVAPGGPLDMTPIDHQYGLGTGPGVDRFESQDRSEDWANNDTGATAARLWKPSIDRDGTFHVEVIKNHPDNADNDSPATTMLERTGVGMPNDPEATVSKRYKRWMDRWIDRHWFEPDRRPRPYHSATTINAAGPVPNGNQTTSPFPNSAAWYAGPSDRFVVTQTRRPPGDWVEPQVTDGTYELVAGAPNEYGLPPSGL